MRRNTVSEERPPAKWRRNLLDTNIIIDAINDKRNRNTALIALAERGNILARAPVNIAEVYVGVRPKEEQKTAAFAP